jgi:hypothetical protein
MVPRRLQGLHFGGLIYRSHLFQIGYIPFESGISLSNRGGVPPQFPPSLHLCGFPSAGIDLAVRYSGRWILGSHEWQASFSASGTCGPMERGRGGGNRHRDAGGEGDEIPRLWASYPRAAPPLNHGVFVGELTEKRLISERAPILGGDFYNSPKISAVRPIGRESGRFYAPRIASMGALFRRGHRTPSFAF